MEKIASRLQNCSGIAEGAGGAGGIAGGRSIVGGTGRIAGTGSVRGGAAMIAEGAGGAGRIAGAGSIRGGDEPEVPFCRGTKGLLPEFSSAESEAACQKRSCKAVVAGALESE